MGTVHFSRFLPAKGDNICDLLFAVLYANPHQKRDLLYQERGCSQRKYFPFSEGTKYRQSLSTL